MLPTLIFGGTAALFLMWTFSALWHLRWVRRLPSLASLTAEPGAHLQRKVRCTVVIAARDEEARITQTIRHLLAQDGPELEIIVVDDRSTDRTSDILCSLAKEDSRLLVKRVD